MNLLIISASQRSISQSAKVARYIAAVASTFSQVSQFDLNQFEGGYWNGDANSKDSPQSHWNFINQKMQKSDAFVLITPEWGGMASPLLKNFLLMSEAKHCANKPVLLVSVSSGIGGTYPIAELKMNAFKNNKMVPIPDHLIVRNVEQVLNKQTFNKQTPNGQKLNDQGLKQDVNASQLNERESNLIMRIDYSLLVLSDYATALKSLRVKREATPYPNQQQFAYGM